jgi:hypothetical protein
MQYKLLHRGAIEKQTLFMQVMMKYSLNTEVTLCIVKAELLVYH